MSVPICPRHVQFKDLVLVLIDTHSEQKYSPVALIENGQELVKLPGEYYSTSNPCFKLMIYFTTPRPFSQKYFASYDRYFKAKLNEYIIENFESGLNMQFHEYCATSVKTMFSQSITQILLFCDNF